MPATLIDIELEQPVPAVADIYRSRDSCMVSDVVAELDAIATRLGHECVSDFHSGWHAAVDGLPTVRAVKAHLEQNPGALFHPEYALVRLRLWERMLQAADAAGVRWQVSAELA